MRRSLLLTILFFVACGDGTGPESLGPRIVSVTAIACPSTAVTLAQCVREGFEIDPARGDSAFHFTLLVPLFQNPPTNAWRLLTVWVDGEMTQTSPVRLGTADPATRTVSDTMVFFWLEREHPDIEIEIAMVEGEDPRFVRSIADTVFIWR